MTDIIKADGTREIFNPSKLRTSLIRARASEEAADAVITQVMSELREGMTTREIYKSAFKHLVEMQKPVAQRYSVRRAMLDMGPTGFPFEDFVAEVLRTKGFETLTRQTVLGGCVPHEMDVVAWNDDKLVMVEAKFHNGLGIKSDLKVALYVKARFDDLKDNMHHYGGRDRKLDEGWLITNTKFSSTALHYGLCQKLTMIGWNYPERGNLQDMIEENPELLDLIFKKHIEQLQ